MSSNNTTTTIATSIQTSNTIIILNLLLRQFVNNLPIIFVILGFIGFIGNALTFLQTELRSNTCSIYLLCGAIADVINLCINLLAIYMSTMFGIYIPWTRLGNFCKFNLFLLGFFPYLSLNFLLMSIIDRYACTCSLTSPIRRLNQLKMVPRLIAIVIIISCIGSMRGPILYNDSRFGCITTQALLNNIIYLVINGIIPSVTMLIFLLLTFRNVNNSRKRVGGTNLNRSRNQFIAMIFTQVFATSFISLQWMIMYTYYFIPSNSTRTYEQWTIINFVYWLTNYCYYLNNVKSFYLSMLTSRVFRQTFIKGLIRLLPRYLRQRWHVLQANVTMSLTRNDRRNIVRRGRGTLD